ncbi:hypothetical protein [Corynebacterium aquilae]|uniref:Uncharacterized protein n=1 Tax=Corynebacterium aquilae DSM 44791 TaxID=1431546 RepID=A0A1L7CFP7_9CORY|nr:hypothetical protein [Corynebacterium aquilae]APT84667.1 hypothetical protein CAQU_05835 [Corynebacterium aquilae DSM 44791]
MAKALYAVPDRGNRVRNTLFVVVTCLIVLSAAFYGAGLVLNDTSRIDPAAEPSAALLPPDDLTNHVDIKAYPPRDGHKCDPVFSGDVPEMFVVGSGSCGFAEDVAGQLLPQLREALTLGVKEQPAGGLSEQATTTSVDPDPAAPDPVSTGTGSKAARVAYVHRGIQVKQRIYDHDRARLLTVTCSLLKPTEGKDSPAVCTAAVGFGMVYQHVGA